MKELLQQEVRQQLDLYKSSWNRMISDFNRERESAGEYNGRQLLEMLQNADDQGADRILIALDEACGVLTISNSGTPFSLEGYQSLMLSNLSPKTKTRFIGNKGLGFRSVITWSNAVSVRSRGLCVRFSKASTRQAFERMFDLPERTEILSKFKLNATAVPVAFLAIPDISDSPASEWATQIEIDFDARYLADIHEQLDDLHPECLLFLNHLTTVEIQRNGVTERLDKHEDGQHVHVNERKWRIRGAEGPLPPELQDPNRDEHEHYSLKLALTPDLESGTDKLYTYFPTKVNMSFPMAVHGTFDLDSSRNQLIKSKKNEYILERLVGLIADTAKELAGDDVNWLPVRLLHCKDSNPVLRELGFYEKLERAVRELAIFPCADNQYRRVWEVYFLGEEFSRFVMESGATDHFPGLLIPGGEAALHRASYRQMHQELALVKRVNELSQKLLGRDITLRARLIAMLTRMPLPANCKFELLLNEHGQLIPSTNEVFTPISSGTEPFALPAFVKIDFMKQDLFNALVDELRIEPGEKARELQRLLKGITNLHSYEPAQVIRKVIASARLAIDAGDVPARQIVADMAWTLFKIRAQLGTPVLPGRENIPLLNGKGAVMSARQLYLSKHYPSGIATRRIFEKVYSPSEYLAGPDAFGDWTRSEDLKEIEAFFLWLGVNQFVRYDAVPPTKQFGYEQHVLAFAGGLPSYRNARIEAYGIDDKQLDVILGSLSKEQIVEWLLRDPWARARLEYENNGDKFEYSKMREGTGTYQHQLAHKPSYLLFQLAKANLFGDFLIHDDGLIDFVNAFHFDYAAQGFVDGGYRRRDIEAILLKLGARDGFEELSFERVCTILRGMPESDPEGRQASKIYRLALRHFDVHQRRLPEDIALFATRGSERGYFGQREVYFNETIRLPKKIVDGKPMLNFPRRSGGAKVPAFFNVRDLKDISVQVERRDRLEGLSERLHTYLNQIKPYLLAYRIYGLQSNKQSEASALARMSIVLCSTVECSADGDRFGLERNDYIKDGSQYLLKVDAGQTLEGLRADSGFCDTFAEIVTSIFEVSELRTEVRSAFKDDLSDVHHVVCTELGSECLLEARQLLGTSDPRSAFWSAVLRCVQQQGAGAEVPATVPELEAYLRSMDVDVAAIEYGELTSERNLRHLARAFAALGVGIPEFNQVAAHQIDLTNHHRSKLRDALHAGFPGFCYSLWEAFKSKDWSARAHFLHQLAKYEHSERWQEETAASLWHTFEADYGARVAEFIRAHFPDLALLQGRGDYAVTYRMQRAGLTEEQLDGLARELDSWLYFDGGLERVAAELRATDAEASESAKSVPPDPAQEPKVDECDATAAPPPAGDGAGKGRALKHSTRKDINNKRYGEDAERLVYRVLVTKYGSECVEHVSVRDDSAGYDIRYSPDNGRSWRMAEVKRYGGGHIHISENQRRKAALESEVYDLFLVTPANEIRLIPSVDFGDKQRFSLVPEEYLVYFTTGSATSEDVEV